MAVVTGTVQAVAGFTSNGPTLKHTISSDEWETECCFITVTFPAGTYAAAGNAEFDAATAIENSKRDGKAVTVLGGVWVSAGDENGAVISAGPCTVSGDKILCELWQEDITTERADGAMSATWNRPLTFCVAFRTKVNGE